MDELKKKLNKEVGLLAGFVVLLVVGGLFLRYSFASTPYPTGSQEFYFIQILVVACIFIVPCIIWWVNKLVKSHRLNENNYFSYALLRLAPTFLLIGMGAFFYILSSDKSMLFAALIGLVFLFFVYPTRERIGRELDESRND